MLSPITKEIENFSVRFRPLPATKAFTLAKRVGTLVLPLVKSIDLSKLSEDVNLNSIIDGIIEMLADLPDEKAVGIIVDSLKGCTITAPGMPPIEIQDSSNIDAGRVPDNPGAFFLATGGATTNATTRLWQEIR